MSNLHQFSLTVQFVQMTCYKCQCSFALNLSTYNRRQTDGGDFWCPEGHQQHFTKTKVQILEEQLAEKQRVLAQKDEHLKWVQAQRNRADRKASAARGQVTKIKNRVGNGVCPCCNRSFLNLGRHMSHMHPDFKKETK